MRRREFIAGLGSAAAWPVVARAQQPAMPVIGWLSGRNSETDAHVLPAFRRGLNRQGYVEGRNVTIEYRWSDTQNDRLPALAADLVRRQVAVIAAVGDAGFGGAGSSSYHHDDSDCQCRGPASGIAFSRPGGNVTGVYAVFGELGGKRIGLLRDLLPRATTIAVLTSLDAPPGKRQMRRKRRECSGCRSKS